MAELELYLYSVNPKRVIRGLSGAQDIRSPRSLLLTKEDVYKCLPLAAVYRRFAAEGRNERVTVDTVERFHRANYLTADEWKALCEGKPVEEAPVVEEVAEQEVAPEVVEEVAPVVEPESNKEEVAEDTVDEMPEEPTTSDPVEEITEEESSTVEVAESLVVNVDEPVVEEGIDESADSEEDDESDDSEETSIEPTASETAEDSTEDQTNKQQFNYTKRNKHKK